MKSLIGKLTVFLIAFFLCSPAHAMERAFGSCEEGGFSVQVGGLPATTTSWMRSFKSCTVTVYLSGLTSAGITSITRSSGTVTATLTATYPTYGLNSSVTVTGVTDTTFNGTFTVSSAPGTTSLSWAQAGVDASSTGGQAAFLPRIFADNNTPTPTVLSNPFVASTDSYWRFYAVAGRYDVRFSLSDIATPYSRADYLLCDPIGPNADLLCGSGGTPFAGETMQKNGTFVGTEPIFNFIEGTGVTLTASDEPAATRANLTISTCTSVQDNGVEIGCEHEINFIEGPNITMNFADNPGNNSVDVTINATGNLSLICDPTKVVNTYVATTGSDITGDGTIGNPYATVQKAIDAKVPNVVDGKYFIYLAAGTYTSAAGIALEHRTFLGGSLDYTECQITTPCSQVYIVGNTAASENYVLNTGNPVVLAADGAYLTLQGVQIQGGAYGLIVSSSFVTLRGIIFKDNQANIMIGPDGRIFLDPYYSVDNAGLDLVSFNRTAAGALTGGYGFIIMPRGFVTDFCDDGNKEEPLNFASVSCYWNAIDNKGVGECIRLQGGDATFRQPLYSERSNVYIEDGTLMLKTFDYDGQSQANAKAININSGKVSGANWSGGNYSVTDSTFGVQFSRGSGGYADLPYDSATFLTAPVTGPPGDSGPEGMLGIHLVQNPGSLLYDLGTTPGATPNFAITRGVVQKLTLNINAVMGTIAGQFPGARATWMVCQPAAGGPFTFAFNAAFKGADTIGVVANRCNLQPFWFDGTNWWATGPMQKDQ